MATVHSLNCGGILTRSVVFFSVAVDIDESIMNHHHHQGLVHLCLNKYK